MWTKLDSWVRELLVDPFSKEPVADLKLVGGIPDFRRKLFTNAIDTQTWKSGQIHYEKWCIDLGMADEKRDYPAEIDGVREVYEDIPLTGRVLDVGGHQGRVRQFLKPDQEYLSCDPFINVFDDLAHQPKLLAAYTCFREPCNFVSAHAEYLPLRSRSFDTVHMRSVIDHFLDPALALMEAHRVLRAGGKLVVGLYVEGGKTGHVTTIRAMKELARDALAKVGIERYADSHVWHPTYAELSALIEAAGFTILKTHWQKNTAEMVCYIEARKNQ